MSKTESILSQITKELEVLETINPVSDIIVLGHFAFQKLNNEVKKIATIPDNVEMELTVVQGVEVKLSVFLGGWGYVKMNKFKYIELKKQGKI